MTTFIEFMRKTVGANWVVVHRRTPRIVAKYGEDVVCLHPKRYAALQAQFDMETAPPLPFHVVDLIRHLQKSCEAGANFIEFYQKKPDQLRAWAARIESGVAPNSISLPALSLRNAAQQAEEFLAADLSRRHSSAA